MSSSCASHLKKITCTKFLQSRAASLCTNPNNILGGVNKVDLAQIIDNKKLNIDSALVSSLITAQFPQWKDFPVQPVAVGGWDNRTFHLGKKMLVRMPSAEEYAMKVEKEQKWLPKLAPLLPLAIPVPLAMGEPGEGYPWRWSIYRWIEGDTAASGRIADMDDFVTRLAQFLIALQRIDATDGSLNDLDSFSRVGALATYDVEARQAITALRGRIDVDAATKIWEAALETTWKSLPVWVHGDISAGNLLVQEGKLRAVIDFGGLGIGDPACDLAIAWKMFGEKSRDVFRAALPLDAGTWARGRGWALWKALIVEAGLTETNAVETAQSWDTINEILTDFKYKYSNIVYSYQRKIDVEDVDNILIYGKQALKIRQALYNDNHPDIAKSLNNIGLAYMNVDIKKALSYLEQALKMRQAIYNGNHSDVANSLTNLGIAYETKGDVEKGLMYKEQALKMMQDLYNYSHTAIAATLFNVGVAYNNIGDQAKGMEYIKQAYVMHCKVLGKNHPDSKKLEKYLSSASPGFFETNENREIIKQRGELDNFTIKIKYQIQKNILNKINDLAAKGVWNKGMISSCEIIEEDWGVNGYINESYLHQKLGKIATEKGAMEIAKMLCFEAICLGIMKSSAKNLTCAIKFAEKYPELIKKIVSIHPEYFIDGSILKSFVRDLELIAKLLGNNPEGMGLEEYEQDNYWYKYSKKAMEEILELRLKSVNAYDVNKVKIITFSETWYNSLGILEEIAQEVGICKESKILIPLNIYNKHWVGIAIDICSGTIKISYMDPEQNAIPIMLKDKLIETIARECPKHHIKFEEAKLEKQIFNNCGPEVIENFINYLTGDRLSQDNAVPAHSALLEDSLLSGLVSDVSAVADAWI